ncbi:MAG: cell wall-binding protein [Lachnospiraceae bacterium]
MKRKSLMIAVCSAMLTLGTASLTAFAASGWVQSGSNWVYYDSSGSQVYNEWRKGADDQWRYIDGDGKMAVNAWVDGDQYYVDSNGIMLTNKWQQVKNDYWGSYDDDAEYVWFYFGPNGKVIQDTWKKIDNKWYFFDSSGVMQTGWVDENMYYCGDDGVMKTGWQKLYPPDMDEYEQDRVTPASDFEDSDGKNWYYFSTSGKKYVPDDDDGDYSQRKVNGVYYCFDSDGAMQTGWVNTGDDDDVSASIEDYRYYGSDGKVKTGWLTLEPPEAIASRYDNDVEWFYFTSNGTPRVGDDHPTVSDLVKINGLTFLFNEDGNPVYGLKKVYLSDNSDDYTAFYFGDRATSSVQKGKRKIEEGDGNEITYYFSETGRGFTGVKDGYLYYRGKLQIAESGERYAVITIPSGNSHTNYVVNGSGRIAKSTTVKNSDGVKYKTGSGGQLMQIDGESVSSTETFDDPQEPVWTE